MVNKPGETKYVMSGVGEGLKVKFNDTSYWIDNGRRFNKSSVKSLEKLSEQQAIYGLVRPAGWEHDKDYIVKVNWTDGQESVIIVRQTVYNGMLIASMSDSNSNISTGAGTGARTGASTGASTGGCYVATCVYGSYDCPEVWTLRRFRDYTLAETWYGRAFIRTYYAVSPTLVKWFGKTKWFKKMWQGKLDRMVKRLNDEGVANAPYQDRNW